MDDSSDIPDISLITGHLRPTYSSSHMDPGLFVSTALSPASNLEQDNDDKNTWITLLTR